MGKYIPVEPEKWGEMVKAMAEVTRLKAEVERLQQDLVAVKYYGELMEFLKANAAKEGKQP